MKKDKQKINPKVYQVTSTIIGKLSRALDTSTVKASLANLRNSIGKTPSETIEIWPIMLDDMPDEFLGSDGNLTAEEEAILNTLQLYALYQQGSSESVAIDKEINKWENMGTYFSNLREDDNRVSTDRRFNTMVTSTTYDELFYHLKQMFGLLKSRSKGQVKVNFSRLSQDLFFFMLGYEDNIRIAWSREYYRNRNVENEKNEGEENEQK